MKEVLDLLLGPGGALALALGAAIAGWKKMWVFGWQYRECIEEKEAWKRAALAGTDVAKALSEHVERGGSR